LGRVVVLLLLLFPLLARADPATLQAADAQIKAGQPAQAVQTLLPLKDSEAGNAKYHYLLGIAYLDSGKLGQAISSLKRSLELDPGLLQAKAELGRAYVLNGEPINAYLTFKEVRAAQPPPEVLAGIERFLSQSARELNQQKKVFGAVSISIGHDSNVNSGTSATNIALPIFGNIQATLNPGANPRRDEFLAASGYVTATQDVTEHLDLLGTLAGSGKYNYHSDLSAYDLETVDVAGGVQYTQGFNQYRALGVFEQLDYGHQQLRSEAGVALDWRRLLELPVELDFNLRHTTLHYPTNDLLNARRDVLGVALLPSFFGQRLQYAPPLANVYFGEERPYNSGSANLGYALWGARAAYYTRVLPSTSVFVSGGYENRRYGAADPVFLTTRVDQQTDASLGAIRELTRTVSLIPSVQWIDTRSNIQVYASQRTLFTLTLRMTF
jgi:tetratricopeptide (TPR) repeat protein